jgi:hypothetical protein
MPPAVISIGCAYPGRSVDEFTELVNYTHLGHLITWVRGRGKAAGNGRNRALNNPDLQPKRLGSRQTRTREAGLLG